MDQISSMAGNLANQAPATTLHTTDPILELKNLHTYFFVERGVVKAVNGVNLSLERRSTLGVVGESGCGKSVTAMSVMRLIKDPPGKIAEGEIWLHKEPGGAGIDIASLDPMGREIRCDPRRRDCHDLPGADDLAQPAAHHRQPDRRDRDVAPEGGRRTRRWNGPRRCCTRCALLSLTSAWANIPIS